MSSYTCMLALAAHFALCLLGQTTRHASASLIRFPFLSKQNPRASQGTLVSFILSWTMMQSSSSVGNKWSNMARYTRDSLCPDLERYLSGDRLELEHDRTAQVYRVKLPHCNKKEKRT